MTLTDFEWGNQCLTDRFHRELVTKTLYSFQLDSFSRKNEAFCVLRLVLRRPIKNILNCLHFRKLRRFAEAREIQNIGWGSEVDPTSLGWGLFRNSIKLQNIWIHWICWTHRTCEFKETEMNSQKSQACVSKWRPNNLLPIVARSVIRMRHSPLWKVSAALPKKDSTKSFPFRVSSQLLTSVSFATFLMTFKQYNEWTFIFSYFGKWFFTKWCDSGCWANFVEFLLAWAISVA